MSVPGTGAPSRSAGTVRRIRRALLGAIVALYVLSIPWYRDPTATPDLVLGLPDWVATALACYVGVAILNAVAWLLPADPADTALGDPPRSAA